MPEPTPAPLSETLATPFGFGMAVYLLIGFLVVLYVGYTCSFPRRRPGDTLPWPRRDNPRQGLDLFFTLGLMSHPIVFLIQIALWPLWLLFLWAYQLDDDEDDDRKSI